MLVAVHAGAGYHSTRKEAEYKELCARACRRANEVYERSRNVVNAANAACRILEDSVETNAGIGSNVTLDGNVECDASIMNGSTLQFGAVGALRGVRNPIDVATALLREQANGLLSLGRIPPSVLVGDGAATWAASHGIELIDPETMLTSSTRKCYLTYRRKINDAQPERRSGSQDAHAKAANSSQEVSVHGDLEAPPAQIARETDKSDNRDLKLDTIGVLCMDATGECCAALSSGGVQLKHAGRLGHAPLFGCGCWAQRYVSTRAEYDANAFQSLDQCDGTHPSPRGSNVRARDSLAVITSGCGEYLARIVFAKSCADFCCPSTNTDADAEVEFETDGASLTRNVRRFFEHDFMQSPYLTNEQRLAGVVCARWSPQRSAFDIAWCHSTSSFAVGYYCAAQQDAPHCFVSRLALADADRRDGVGIFTHSSNEQIIAGGDSVVLSASTATPRAHSHD